MHQNSPYWEPKSNIFLEREHSPLPRPSPPRWEGDTPPTPHPLGAFGASILAPAALDLPHLCSCKLTLKKPWRMDWQTEGEKLYVDRRPRGRRHLWRWVSFGRLRFSYIYVIGFTSISALILLCVDKLRVFVGKYGRLYRLHERQ